MKVFLIIPPIDWHLSKIRGGWERRGASKDGTTSRAGHYDLERADYDGVKPVSVMTKPQTLGQAQAINEIPPVESAWRARDKQMYSVAYAIKLEFNKLS